MATDVSAEAVSDAVDTFSRRAAVGDEVLSDESDLCSDGPTVRRRLVVVDDVPHLWPTDYDNVIAALVVETSIKDCHKLISLRDGKNGQRDDQTDDRTG